MSEVPGVAVTTQRARQYHTSVAAWSERGRGPQSVGATENDAILGPATRPPCGAHTNASRILPRKRPYAPNSPIEEDEIPAKLATPVSVLRDSKSQTTRILTHAR